MIKARIRKFDEIKASVDSSKVRVSFKFFQSCTWTFQTCTHVVVLRVRVAIAQRH